MIPSITPYIELQSQLLLYLTKDILFQRPQRRMSKLRPQLVFANHDTQMIRLVGLIPHVLWGKILSGGPRLDSGHGPNPSIAVGCDQPGGEANINPPNSIFVCPLNKPIPCKNNVVIPVSHRSRRRRHSTRRRGALVMRWV